jgi:hypothetical protein
VSRHWPGWRTLPGIEIAPIAEKARQRGEPVTQLSHVWGPDERYVTSCGWQVDADGTVSIPWDENWEPVVEDGMLTGFRGKRGGTIEKLVQVSALVVPEGEPPWTPALTVRLPPEQIGMYSVGDSIADGIDVETGPEPAACITLGFTGADGSFTSMVWGLTPESAASVIALIRERHGEPSAEFTTDREHTGALHEAALAAVEANAVFTCAHDAEGEGAA